MSVSYEHMAGCYDNLDKIVLACEEICALLSEAAAACRPGGADEDAGGEGASEWKLFDLSLGVVTKQRLYLENVFRSLPKLVPT